MDKAESVVCRNSALSLQYCILKCPIAFTVCTDPSLAKLASRIWSVEGSRLRLPELPWRSLHTHVLFMI